MNFQLSISGTSIPKHSQYETVTSNTHRTVRCSDIDSTRSVTFQRQYVNAKMSIL